MRGPEETPRRVSREIVKIEVSDGGVGLPEPVIKGGADRPSDSLTVTGGADIGVA